jgi:CheY-like chemotaxis protein
LTEEFDVVITNFRMSRMGGLELTAIIRTLFGDSLKIIGMSSSDDCEDQFRNIGTDAFLTKPIESDDLLKVIKICEKVIACPITTAH